MAQPQRTCAQCGKDESHFVSLDHFLCSYACYALHTKEDTCAGDDSSGHSKPLVLSGNMARQMEKDSQEPLTVLYTDENCQFALERVAPGKTVPREIHATQTQIIIAYQGKANINIYYAEDITKLYKTVELEAHSPLYDDWVIIHANTYHEVVNASNDAPFLFSTAYAPHVH